MGDNKVIIDGEEYDLDSLSDNAKHAVLQIQSLNSKKANVHAELSQIEMALSGFGSLLGAEMQEHNKED